MALMAAINVIGLVSGSLGIVQFAKDNFAPPETAKSVIKIGVGLDTKNGLSNAGGDLPDVRLWNEGGEFLGMSADPGDIDDGTTAEIEVKHNGDVAQQATYALFSANDNAICIAYASITWPDGNEYGWIGDWGRECGTSWYFSNYLIKGSKHKPDCMWIDANGDQPQTGFQIHWPEFVTETESVPSDKDINYFCNSGPPFKIRTDPDPNGVTYWTLNRRDESILETSETYSPSKGPRRPRRASSARSPNRRDNGVYIQPMSRLIIDDNPDHSTSKLCESDTSTGPDFANHADGLFCRMSDKTLWPLCSEQVVDSCFDTTTSGLRINGIVARGERYEKVTTWG